MTENNDISMALQRIEQLLQQLKDNSLEGKTIMGLLQKSETEIARQGVLLDAKDEQIDALVETGAKRRQEIVDLNTQIAAVNSELAYLKGSFSMRITAPIRKIRGLFWRG